MKAYKVEILVLDFEHMPEGDIVYFIENIKHLYPKVMSIQSKEIGEWNDDHPLNRKDTAKQTYDDLWKNDFRTLCSELLAALENAIRVIHHEDGTNHISTADAVIAKANAALAQPPAEFEKPTSRELFDLWKACNSPSVFGRMVLERWGNLSTPTYPNPEN